MCAGVQTGERANALMQPDLPIIFLKCLGNSLESKMYIGGGMLLLIILLLVFVL